MDDYKTNTGTSYLIPGSNQGVDIHPSDVGGEVEILTSGHRPDNDLMCEAGLKSNDEVCAAGEVGDLANNEDFQCMKERVALAESELDSLKLEKSGLLQKISELEAQLASSLENQQKFMIANDKATVSLDAVNEDTATKVANLLKPNLLQLPDLSASIKQTHSKMDTFSTSINSLNDGVTGGKTIAIFLHLYYLYGNGVKVTIKFLQRVPSVTVASVIS